MTTCAEKIRMGAWKRAEDELDRVDKSGDIKVNKFYSKARNIRVEAATFQLNYLIYSQIAVFHKSK